MASKNKTNFRHEANLLFAMVITVLLCLIMIGCSTFEAKEHAEAGNELLEDGRFDEAIAESL